MRAFISCLFICIGLYLQAQTYIPLADLTGFDRSRYQAELDSAAQDLAAVFELTPAIQSQFKVFDFGFYLHQTKVKDGIPEAFALAQQLAARQAPYYLLFAKQSDEMGLYSEFLVDLQLPNNNFSACLTENWENMLEEQLRTTINKIHTENGRNPFLYADAEIEAMRALKSSIFKLVDCCQKSNARSTETCTNCALAKEGMIDNLRAADFLGLDNVIVEIDSILTTTTPEGYSNLVSDFKITLSNHGYTWQFTDELEKMLNTIPGSSGRVLYFNESNCNEFEAIYGPINPTSTATLGRNSSQFSEEIVVLDFDGEQQIFFKFSETAPLESFEKWLLRHITIDNESGATYFFTALALQKCFAGYESLSTTFNDETVASWAFFKMVFEEARKVNGQNFNSTAVEAYIKQLFHNNNTPDYSFEEVRDILLADNYFNRVSDYKVEFKKLAENIAEINNDNCSLCLADAKDCLSALGIEKACSYKTEALRIFLIENKASTNLNMLKSQFERCADDATAYFNRSMFFKDEKGKNYFASITTLENGVINLNEINCNFDLSDNHQNAVFSLFFKNDTDEVILAFTAKTLVEILSLADYLGFDSNKLSDCLLPKIRERFESVDNNNCDEIDALLSGFQSEFLTTFFDDNTKYAYLESILSCKVDGVFTNEKDIIISLLKSFNNKEHLYDYLNGTKSIEIGLKLEGVKFVGSWAHFKEYAKVIHELCQQYWREDQKVGENIGPYFYHGTITDVEVSSRKYYTNFYVREAKVIGDKMRIRWSNGRSNEQTGPDVVFEAGLLDPVRFYKYPSEEGTILPLASILAIAFEKNNTEGLNDLLSVLNLFGFTASARILLNKNTGTLLRLLALVDIGKIAIDQALLDPSVRAELETTPEGQKFLATWTTISAIIDVATLSGSLLDNLIASGPTASKVMRKHGKNEAAKKLDDCTGATCFVAGTIIQIPNGDKSIEKIQAGDAVYAYDFVKRAVVVSEVTGTTVKKTGRLWKVITEKDTLTTTAEHPFYTNNGWTPAEYLEKGIKVVSLADGLVTIDTVFAFDSLATVYNFEVEREHNYFVGGDGVLVHNSYRNYNDLIDGIDEDLSDEIIAAIERDFRLSELFDENIFSNLRRQSGNTNNFEKILRDILDYGHIRLDIDNIGFGGTIIKELDKELMILGRLKPPDGSIGTTDILYLANRQGVQVKVISQPMPSKWRDLHPLEQQQRYWDEINQPFIDDLIDEGADFRFVNDPRIDENIWNYVDEMLDGPFKKACIAAGIEKVETYLSLEYKYLKELKMSLDERTGLMSF